MMTESKQIPIDDPPPPYQETEGGTHPSIKDESGKSESQYQSKRDAEDEKSHPEEATAGTSDLKGTEQPVKKPGTRRRIQDKVKKGLVALGVLGCSSSCCDESEDESSSCSECDSDCESDCSCSDCEDEGFDARTIAVATAVFAAI
eukprot:TRINITY_DN49790_c0_g1_i1.p1 TRINITY_DN49790_c0_g1~~TRINITY_DN49790_c0_g1_i1.p1  ORF type:complete len:146 (-),score=15.90 TRINITY_DN49790_c0_g1_i1:22-459(-)